MAYEVHLDVYDGPFNLLLQLITAQQVDLYEVRLSDIVDAFLAELSRLESLDLEVATEFLLIAATLVELKCRRLLPGSGEVDLDEELSLFEARDYLLARLLECKTFSQAAAALAALEQAAAQSHGRRAGPEEHFLDLEPDLLAGVTPEQLARLAARALAPREVPVISVAHVHEDEVSVSETLERLVEELPALGRATLQELLDPEATTAAFVACFLALLELYKRELVDLQQLETFGELTVIWSGEGAQGASLGAAEVRAEYDLEEGADYEESDFDGAALLALADPEDEDPDPPDCETPDCETADCETADFDPAHFDPADFDTAASDLVESDSAASDLDTAGLAGPGLGAPELADAELAAPGQGGER